MIILIFLLKQIEPLWNLLFEIIYFIKYGLIDDVCIRAQTELTLGMACSSKVNTLNE